MTQTIHDPAAPVPFPGDTLASRYDNGGWEKLVHVTHDTGSADFALCRAHRGQLEAIAREGGDAA